MSTDQGGPHTSGDEDWVNEDSPASSGLNARIDSALERSAGIDSMPLSDSRERQVVLRAVAIAYSVTQGTAVLLALLLAASGLWWAAIALALAVLVPGVVAKHYARKRGVDLYWQSGMARNETSLKGLGLGSLIVIAVYGLIAFNSAHGHPLLPWSWRMEHSSSAGFTASLLIGALAGTAVGWLLRRRKYRSKLETASQPSTNGTN